MAQSKAVSLPPPTPIALVLCDNVYRDRHGKQALVGLFHEIYAQRFPAIHPRMCAYVSITSIRPNTNCSLDIVHAETDATVMELSGPAPKDIGPNEVWDVVFEFPPVTFPEAGQYYVRFLGNNQVLMQRRFHVIGMDHAMGDDEHEQND